KLTKPLPALNPMSPLVVPSNEPAPVLSQMLNGLLAGSPTADLLPYASQVQTRGGGVKSVATVPLDGWLAKNNCVAGPGAMAITTEVVLDRVPLLKPRVIFVAKL